MKKQGLRIFSYFTVVLMLASILPGGAFAASDNAMDSDMSSISGSYGNDQVDDASQEDSDDDTTQLLDRERDRDRDMVNATDDATRKRTEAQKEKRSDAAANYMAAKNNFVNIKSKNPNLYSEEAINATKEYLISSIDYMIANLDDEQYIDELNDEKNKVKAATTRKELGDSAKHIRSIWNDARKNHIVSAGKNIDNKINAIIKTSDALIIRLENEIATMKENGEDVEELEELLAQYKERINDANKSREQARNIYQDENGTNAQNMQEANAYLQQAGKDIKESNVILRNMLKELHQHRQGVIVLAGSENLSAEGNGTAVISGDVVIDLTAIDAKLVIKDFAGDAQVNTYNADYESSNIDAGNSTDNNRAFVFLNLTGDVHIEGSRLTVMLRSSDMEFTAEGTGTAVLSGNGTYEYTGNSGVWAPRYADSSENEIET